jgi:hypothetical protein
MKYIIALLFWFQSVLNNEITFPKRIMTDENGKNYEVYLIPLINNNNYSLDS